MHAHRRLVARRRRRACHRQRPRDPGRRTPAVQRQVGRRDRDDHAARGRQVRWRRLQGVGRTARRGRVGGERAVVARRARSRPRRPYVPAGVRGREVGARSGEARSSAGQVEGGRTVEARAHRHQRHLLARPRRVRRGRVPLRDDRRAVAGDGVLEPRPHDRPARRTSGPQAVGGVLERLRHRRLRASSQPVEGAVVQGRRLLRRPRPRRRGRGRMAVEHRLPRRSALVRERHLHDRRRDARRRLPAGAHAGRQPLRQGSQSPEGQGRGLPGRRRAGRTHGDRVGAPDRSAVRRSDQGEVGQHRDAFAGRARREHAPLTLARGAPEPGEGDRRQGRERGAGPLGGEVGARPDAPKDRARRRGHARQARRLRVTRPRRRRALPGGGRLGRRFGATPATRRTRRSCRCEARS